MLKIKRINTNKVALIFNEDINLLTIFRSLLIIKNSDLLNKNNKLSFLEGYKNFLVEYRENNKEKINEILSEKNIQITPYESVDIETYIKNELKDEEIINLFNDIFK